MHLPGRYRTRHLEGQMGAREVELDTQLATDGVVVLCHDGSLSVTGMDGHDATPSTDRCSVSRVKAVAPVEGRCPAPGRETGKSTSAQVLRRSGFSGQLRNKSRPTMGDRLGTAY